MKTSPLRTRYVIVAGINGVGKSSFIGAKYSNLKDAEIINADELTKKHNGNIMQGGKAAVSLIKQCFNEKKDFLQETTLSGNSILENAKKAKELGYFIALNYIGIDSKEESIERIANRVRKGGHNIPKSDVERRYEKRVDDFMKMLPYCDSLILYDNDNGFKMFGFNKLNGYCLDPSFPIWFDPFIKRLIEKGYKIYN